MSINLIAPSDTIRRRVGEVLRIWGSSGSENRQFKEPRQVAVDGKGLVFVVGFGNPPFNSRRLRVSLGQTGRWRRRCSWRCGGCGWRGGRVERLQALPAGSLSCDILCS